MRRLVCEEIRTGFQQIFVVGINFTVVPRSMLCAFPIPENAQDTESAGHAQVAADHEVSNGIAPVNGIQHAL